ATQRLNVDVLGRNTGANSDLGGASSSFAQRHAGCHDAGCTHGFVRGGDRSASNEQVLDLLRHERAIGDVVAIAAPDQRAAFVARTVDVDRVGGNGNRVVEM